MFAEYNFPDFFDYVPCLKCHYRKNHHNKGISSGVTRKIHLFESKGGRNMRSIQDIIDNQGAEAYRAARKKKKKALMELVKAYKASSSPAETLDQLSDINDAGTVIATLVNLSAHDGRISNETKSGLPSLAITMPMHSGWG